MDMQIFFGYGSGVEKSISAHLRKVERNIVTYQRCARTRFWIFWIRTPTASNRIGCEVFFPVAGSGLDFVFTEKMLRLFAWLIYSDTNRSWNAWIKLAEMSTGLGLDWTRTIANFVKFGLDPDCKSLRNVGTGPDLDWVNGK